MTSGLPKEDTIHRMSEETQKRLHQRAIELRTQFPEMKWKKIAERIGVNQFRLKAWRDKWGS